MGNKYKEQSLFDDDYSYGNYGGSKKASSDNYYGTTYGESYKPSNYSGGYFGFGRSFWKKKSSSQNEDIIRPDLNWSQEDDLNELVKSVHAECIGERKIREDAAKLPEFMSRDIFKMYYNTNEELEFDIKKGKKWWHHLLSETDNYMMKIITNNNFSNSYLLTKSILKKMQEIAAQENEKMEKQMKGDNDQLEQQAESQDGQGGEGDSDEEGEEGQKGSGNQNKKQTTPEKGRENKPYQPSPKMERFKKAMKEGIKDAVKEISKKEHLKKVTGMGEEALGSADGLNMMSTILEEVKNISLSKNELSRFIKKSIKGMRSAIAGKVRKKEENLLEADEISDIPEAHLLMMTELLDDMEVTTDIHTFKFNAYIDCSGSMSSSAPLGKRESIRRMTLAKILLFKMKNMNILNDIRGFESSVYKTVTKHDAIMSLNAGGGTRIDSVIRHIQESGIPSLIVSDGDDHVNEYDPNAFMLCLVSPVSMDCKPGKCGEKYVNGKQLVLYNNGKFSYPFIKGGNLQFREEKQLVTSKSK